MKNKFLSGCMMAVGYCALVVAALSIRCVLFAPAMMEQIVQHII